MLAINELIQIFQTILIDETGVNLIKLSQID